MREQAIKNLLRECSAYITEKTQEIYSLTPGSGNYDGLIMVIGSSPTSKEEATGIFLEGKPGEAFDTFLKGASVTRDELYMTYAVKFRPYTVNTKTGRIVHRDINAEEIGLVKAYLAREIEIIKPRLIITLGDMAYRAVAGLEADVTEQVGKKTTVTVEEIIYDILPMPHPKERSFPKIADRDEVKKAMKVQIGSIDYTTPEDDVSVYIPPQVDSVDDVYESEDVGGSDVYSDMSSDQSYLERAIESSAARTSANDATDVTKLISDRLKDLSAKEDKEAAKESYASFTPAVDAYEMVRPSGRPVGTRRKKRSESAKKKVIVVYGGTNLADDPTYVAVDRASSVLTELSVTIRRIDLYKNDYSIDAFIDELAGADGVILATTVEWFGIGGGLQTFLDKCYNSGRYEAFSGAYLFGIVVSRQSYERDAYAHIIKSWEILGGVEGVSLLTSIENSADLETDNELLMAVDKKAEDYYRIINQQRLVLPTSIHDHKVVFKVPVKSRIDEGEQMMMKQVVSADGTEPTMENQMSFISNYDEFIEKQQRDIEDISSLFKEKLMSRSDIVSKTFPEIFEYKYRPDKTFSDCTISWVVSDRSNENFVMEFKGARLKANFGRKTDGDVVMTSSFDVLSKITEGKLTVQRAFMTGEIKAKGNFTLLYKLDQLFAF